jgi:hypothetical protein
MAFVAEKAEKALRAVYSRLDALSEGIGASDDFVMSALISAAFSALDGASDEEQAEACRSAAVWCAQSQEERLLSLGPSDFGLLCALFGFGLWGQVGAWKRAEDVSDRALSKAIDAFYASVARTRRAISGGASHSGTPDQNEICSALLEAVAWRCCIDGILKRLRLAEAEGFFGPDGRADRCVKALSDTSQALVAVAKNAVIASLKPENGSGRSEPTAMAERSLSALLA